MQHPTKSSTAASLHLSRPYHQQVVSRNLSGPFAAVSELFPPTKFAKKPVGHPPVFFSLSDLSSQSKRPFAVFLRQLEFLSQT